MSNTTNEPLTVEIIKQMRELDAAIAAPENQGNGQDEANWDELGRLLLQHSTELFDLAEEALRRRGGGK